MHTGPGRLLFARAARAGRRKQQQRLARQSTKPLVFHSGDGGRHEGIPLCARDPPLSLPSRPRATGGRALGPPPLPDPSPQFGE